MKNRIILTLSLATLFAACSPKLLYTPTDSIASASGSSLAELNQGKTLYQNNCGKCHALAKPESRTAEKWVHVLDAMQPKAKISDDQRALIYKYLAAAPRK